MPFKLDYLLTNFGIVLGILIATLIVAYVFTTAYNKLIKASTQILHNDPTNYKFIGHSLTAMIYIVGFLLALSEINVLSKVTKYLLAGAGILTVAIGFASQHAFSNIISGLFIVVFKPFRVNDRLRIKETLSGVVEDITLRHTVIRDFENRRIIIPNSIISDEVIINSDIVDDNICKFIEFNISFESDITLAKNIIREEIIKHRFFIDHRNVMQIAEGIEEVPVRVLEIGEYFVKIRGWAWASDSGKGFEMACDLFESIKKRFDAEGVIIPYPYRVLVNPQDLDRSSMHRDSNAREDFSKRQQLGDVEA
ncbi:MAG: mechanosensitive ion channel family protein [Saprospiraceae bacterium]